jgi:type VII secretion integral membrane protein EccD
MEYTRLTVRGSRNKAELVVPDDEAISELLPEIVSLLDEPVAGDRPLALATLTGETLEQDASLADQNVAHGSWVQLIPIDEVPPPPIVVDVAQAVSEAREAQPDRWGASSAGWVSALLLGALGVGIAITGMTWAPFVAVATLELFAVIAVVSAIWAGRFGYNAFAWGAAALAGGLLGPAVFVQVPLMNLRIMSGDVLQTQAIGLAAGAAVPLAIVAFWGTRRRPIAVAAAIVAGWAVVALGILLLGVAALDAWAWSGILAAIAIGFVPSLSLAIAGVSRFDDAVLQGERLSRNELEHTIHEAFRVTAGSTWTLSGLAAAAMTMLVISGNAWAAGLALAIAVVMLARIRMLPLASVQVAMVAGVVVPLVAWGALDTVVDPLARMAVCVVVAIVCLLFTLARFSTLALAKLRRWASAIELFAVIALIPLVLGVMHVYSDLLASYR